MRIKNPDFLPRCEWALRTGFATLIAATVALVTPDAVVMPGFGAFVAVMVVERTVGKTFSNVVGCAKSAAYAAISSSKAATTQT